MTQLSLVTVVWCRCLCWRSRASKMGANLLNFSIIPATTADRVSILPLSTITTWDYSSHNVTKISTFITFEIWAPRAALPLYVRMDLKETEWGVVDRVIWCRRGTVCGLCDTATKSAGIDWPDGELLVCQERLCCMEFVTLFVCMCVRMCMQNRYNICKKVFVKYLDCRKKTILFQYRSSEDKSVDVQALHAYCWITLMKIIA
jgi:hypothetical protein